MGRSRQHRPEAHDNERSPSADHRSGRQRGSLKKYDQQLERLRALKSEPLTPALVAEVRKALTNKSSNYLVSKAAAVVQHHRIADLIPDLVAAFRRFLGENAAKTDPQCWAKTAIATALAELGHDNPDVYLEGISHHQPEPVWGGVQDTAGPVRAQCAIGLVGCRSLRDTDLLGYLLNLLVDADKTVRLEGAKAIGQVGRKEATLLLRLKALTGDKEPEVTGSCLTAILSVERADAVEFVKPFLEKEADLAAEAALALGLARLPEAIPLLTARYRRERDLSVASVMLTALAISHQPEAVAELEQIIETDGADRALAALHAVSSAKLPGDWREAAVRNPDPKVGEACS